MTLSPQLEILIILFGISLIIWILLLIYKSRLARQEEQQVFLGTPPERLGEKQTELLKKVNRLSKPLWIFGLLTIFLLLATLGVWIYQGLLSS
jgi:uncharacterized membrane protein